MSASELVRHLPLRPSAFAVLAALAAAPLPGFEILEAAESTGVRILGPGTLYRLMRELRAEGWVERVAAPAGKGTDERRHYHALTETGRDVLRLEAARLRRTLEQAEAAG